MIYLGVCGWPVAHSRSPQMHNAALAAAALDGWRYLRLPLPPALFAETVRALPAAGFRGANATIPHDCADGFLHAYWRRPHAYLDAEVRAHISVFARVGEDAEAAFVAQLAQDLESGAWHERNAAITELEELDCGYRLLVAEIA